MTKTPYDGKMYVKQEPDGMWTLRQERFRTRLEAGKEHPHDVCGVARSYDELRDMMAKHWPAAFKPSEDQYLGPHGPDATR